MRKTICYALSLLLFVAALPLTALAFVAPVATSFSTAVAVNAQTVIQLQGSDADGTALTYATVSSPSHGTLSNLNTGTGALIYTPAADYSGADSFTYTVASGGDTTAAATVTLTVTNAKTRVLHSFTAPDGTAMQGKVSFF
ncbi:MAG TPA: Ig-like domain-containing protein, partial [Pyrinomonadaceae bacterium]